MGTLIFLFIVSLIFGGFYYFKSEALKENNILLENAARKANNHLETIVAKEDIKLTAKVNEINNITLYVIIGPFINYKYNLRITRDSDNKLIAVIEKLE